MPAHAALAGICGNNNLNLNLNNNLNLNRKDKRKENFVQNLSFRQVYEQPDTMSAAGF